MTQYTEDNEVGKSSELVTEKLTDWKNEPTLEDLKLDYTGAKVEHDGQMIKISNWLDNLHIRNGAKPQAQEGKSQVAPKVIRKQAEWRYAALSEPFLSNPNIFRVSPVGPSDKRAAQQNQLLLNNQFNTKINKVRFFDTYVRSVVDEGTVICRTGWSFEEKEVEELQPIYSLVQDPSQASKMEELAAIQETDPLGFDSKIPQQLKDALDMTMKTGIPHKAIKTGTRTVKVKRTVRNHPTVEVCNAQNVILDPTCGGDISKAKFAIYFFETSKSELQKAGLYKNLDKIVPATETVLSVADHAVSNDSSFTFKDDPRKKIIAFEYWGFWDIHDTGEVEAIVGTWVGNTLIRLEENPYPDQELPFVAVPYLPVKESVYGEPDGELLLDNQKIVGAVTRGMIDVMARSANGQQGYRKDALDTVNKRKFKKGEDYEFNPSVDPRQAFYMHTYPEIPNSAGMMIQMQQAEAESLTGVIPFNNGIGEGYGANTAAGVRGAMDAASKREMGILRRLNAGLIEIGRKFIAMNAIFLEDEEVVRITEEEFIMLERDDLRGHFDLDLTISTAEEDQRKAEELSFMLQTIGPNGDPKMVYQIMADIARLRKMPDLAKRLEEYSPQPDPIAVEGAQLENDLKKAEIARVQAETQKLMMEAQMAPLKGETEAAKANKLRTEAEKNTLDFVEQETGTKQERDLEKMRAQAQAQGQTKMLEAVLNNKGE